MKIKLFFLILWLTLPPRAMAQTTAEELGQLWISAIKSKNGETIRNAIHPLCPAGSVPQKLIRKMLSGKIPDKVTVVTQPIASPEVYKQTYAVMPEFQLLLNYVSNDEDTKKIGKGKSQPVSKYNGKWYFANCPKTRKQM